MKPKLPAAPEGGDSKLTDAEQIVKNYTKGSLVVGVVPLPVVDLVVLTGIQLGMLSRLSGVYEVEFSEQQGKALIGSLVGGGGTALASTASYRLALPFLPVGGWAIGIVSTAVFAAATTYALGKVFIQHFASGGTFLTLDPDKVREYYQQLLEQGTPDLEHHLGGVKP